MKKYTKTQGQYLAFIYYFTKLNRIAPAERDFQNYFRVASSSIHSMIKKLEECGFITKTPGEARSIELLLTRVEIPDLE